MRRRRSEDASNRAEEFFLIGTIISRTIIAIFLVPFECSLTRILFAAFTPVYSRSSSSSSSEKESSEHWAAKCPVSHLWHLCTWHSILSSMSLFGVRPIQFDDNSLRTLSIPYLSILILRIFIFVSRHWVPVSIVHFD